MHEPYTIKSMAVVFGALLAGFVLLSPIGCSEGERDLVGEEAEPTAAASSPSRGPTSLKHPVMNASPMALANASRSSALSQTSFCIVRCDLRKPESLALLEALRTEAKKDTTLANRVLLVLPESSTDKDVSDWLYTMEWRAQMQSQGSKPLLPRELRESITQQVENPTQRKSLLSKHLPFVILRENEQLRQMYGSATLSPGSVAQVHRFDSRGNRQQSWGNAPSDLPAALAP